MENVPDIKVKLPKPPDVKDDWYETFFRGPHRSSKYWLAGGALVVYGHKIGSETPTWHTFGPGHWVRVEAEFGPDGVAD